mgnify:CR=1 FL=1
MAKPKAEEGRSYKNIPDACIPCATSFTGDISTKAGVRIDGSIKGDVTAAGNVVIGPEGQVEGQISGRDINIAGGVTGAVTSSATVQLLSGARLLGDVEAVSLAIEEGKCSIGPADKGPMSSARLVDKPAATEPAKP